MLLPNLKGFWSYVHRDDEAEGGRIARLAKDVVSQFELLTGETVDLFLDQDRIKWGEDWRNEIDSNLVSVAFFIPVITPRYFASPECRRELQAFTRKATSLGKKELILPLLYVDFPALHDEETDDDLHRTIRTFQWQNWAGLRFIDVDKEEYRCGVHSLATRLADINSRLEKTVDITSKVLSIAASPEELDEIPGILDRISGMEEAIPKLSTTLIALTEDMDKIGFLFNKSAEDVKIADGQGSGFNARVIVARRLARNMESVVEHTWNLANDFASQLHEIDDGMRAIIELASEEVRRDPEAEKQICEFFKAVLSLSSTMDEALTSSQIMVNSLKPLEKMSRDLRPLMRKLSRALTLMIEGQRISEDWVQLINQSGID